MPTLKQLTCNVEWAGSKLPLREYHTIYADGYVETYIPVPSTPTPFSIHLRSHGYIAPGIAMFVYMDGVYQCNRNRRNLNIPGENTSRKKTEVDFTVRQKEELLWDGTFEGKQWRFEKVKIVPNSDVDDENRPPHNGEYVGTIEVVVLRCLSTNKQPVIGNESSSDESSNVNEKDTPADLDGASYPQPESKSKSVYYTQVLGLDGGWDDWGPPPPPLNEPKMGRIEMTSENTGTWNPVGQTSKSSNGLEKTKRWDKRSESREHFISDFQKHGSPAGSQRGRSSQPRSNNDQETAPQLNLRGGGPGSYSIASSEAMRNWNRGPPAVKESAQGDTSSKGEGGVPAAFDPWTANLPTGECKSEAEAKPQTLVGAWGTIKEPRNKSGSKKGNKDSVVSTDPNPVPSASGRSNHQTQGNNGDDWDTSENGGDAWGGARKTNLQNHDQWNASSDSALARNDDWNNDSSWDAANNNEKKDDGGWGLPNSTSNAKKDDWGGDENNDTQQNGEWGATDDKGPEQNDNWGATTDNDAQRGKSWGGEIGQQADTWGGDDTKQVTAGAKDPEKVNKAPGNQSTASGEKTGSSLSFGNSRAKDPKLVSKVGSQGKPASAKSKASSIKSGKKPLTFDWLKPSLGKAVNASGSPIVAEKASVPGPWASPEASPKQWELAGQVPPTFSISTLPKPKPYWSTWRNPNTSTGAEIEEEQVPAPRESEEPVYSIPVEVAQRNMMSHQVRPDRPAAYTHKRNKPKYMDTHENPYAVFLFKYRDKEIIEHMLETSISEPEVDEKARLASLSKQELIDELIKTKSKLSVAESDSSGQATFVKKLDEKLRKLETGKEDVPAIGDWVKTTSPTDGHGNHKAGASGTKDTLKGNEGGDVGIINGRDKGEDKNRDDNAGADASAGASGGVNGDGNGKSDWNDNGNGNGGNDWGAPNQSNGAEKKDDNGWSLNDSSGGGEWNNDNNNKGADTKPAGDWGNNDDGTKVTGEWGTDHVGDQGGNSRDDGGGRGDGGWGENDGKKDKSNGDDDAGFENSWGAYTGGGGW